MGTVFISREDNCRGIHVAQFVTSSRGNRILKLNGYSFYSDRAKARGPKRRWRCSTHCKQRCRATVMTVDDVIISATLIHNHE
ncbi:uncharacterized protein LOC125242281 [Leguminivora glycinivorella]|uniref:uncharacterized protein LOC125242281 n=1 Tax=Leguminivora glycinivorella TaxID=1035111 RepID=UPI00200FFF4A|nr:uncharacterized protein LOC125242281 [Leguminivora glycinivorella]